MTKKMPFFHVAMIVPDIEAAKAELTAAMGISWRETRDSSYGDWAIKVAYSVEGPPYIELVQGGEGGPWDVSGGPRIDHFGVWSDDIAADRERFAEAGIAMDFDPASVGRPATFSYHRAPAAGTRIELVNSDLKKLRGLE